MSVYGWIIVALWLVMVAYWLVSAAGAKRNLGARRRWWEVGLRVAVVIMIVLIVRVPALRHVVRDAQLSVLHESPWLGFSGAALCALGIGFAFAARLRLGRNWGMPMARKEHPELVTSGPYALVRHPIYTGVILAMLGTAIAASPVYFVLLVVFGAYFIHSALREEALMLTEFPDAYPAYMRRTKRLIPFVW